MLGGALLAPACFDVPIVRGRIERGRIALPSFGDDALVRVRAEGLRRPVVLVRDGSGWVALVGECTHRGCTLDLLPDGFECPCHGSWFDFGGQPHGGPASRPLERLPVAREGDGWVIGMATEETAS